MNEGFNFANQQQIRRQKLDLPAITSIQPQPSDANLSYFRLAVRFICICKLDGLSFTVHVKGFLLRGVFITQVVTVDLTIAVLGLGLGLVAGVSQGLELLSGVTAVLCGLHRHVNFVCR